MNLKKLLLALMFSSFLSFPLTSFASTFNDVENYTEEINFLASKGIIKGYENGMFRPYHSINRIQAVQMILRAQGITDLSAPNPHLIDMKPGDYGYAEVAKAVEMGYINGKMNMGGQKYFDPYGILTRAQMAKILVTAYELEGIYEKDFSDIHYGNWAYGYVNALAANNITIGYQDGSFKPDLNLSREHFSVFMARILDEYFKPVYTKETRFTAIMKDEKGNQYKVYLLGINDRKWVAGPNDIWAGIDKGDILYEGDFQVGLQPVGFKDVFIQPDFIKDYQYNKTRNTIFTFQSKSKEQPDFLFVSTQEASNTSSASAYYIKNGTLQKTQIMSEGNLSDEFYFSYHPKSIGDNRLQLINYYNAEPIGWEFTTYKFIQQKGTFVQDGSKSFFDSKWDEGKREVNKWLNDSDYYVVTP